ncbi:T9SS type A sorting domain-containing protein [Bacteroidota bacterium]
MFKLLILFFGLLFSLSSSLALDSLSFRLTIEDELGGKRDNMLFGIHKDATNDIDTALGEAKTPEFEPPDDLYAVFFVTDSTTMERFWSYVDFRPISDSEKFVRYYRVKIFNHMLKYSISWPKIEGYIDSAFIQDHITGNIIKVNMKDQQIHHFENPSQDQFNIVVYYNKSLIDVDEKTNEDVNKRVNIFPNPVFDELKFLCEADNITYKITNISGNEIIKGRAVKGINLIDFTNYSDGIYFMITENKKGETLIKKIIKY